MNGFYFTFRSVTMAQRAHRALSAAGIPATMQRTPGALAVNGCGYCLRVTARWANSAAHILRDNGVQRCYYRSDVGFEEAPCDIL